LNQAIVVNPQDPEAYNSRGNFYANIFNLSNKTSLPLFYNSADDTKNKAFKDYDMAISLNPKIAIYYYNRGKLRTEVVKSYKDDIFKVFERGPERQRAINDLNVAAGLYLEANEDYNYRAVLNIINGLR
jgi:tetratricopeptide (TPR) repeat protein